MIRKLNSADKAQTLTLLYQDPTYNIFIIGDIETFGFETDFQHVYGEFNQSNRLESVLLIYYKNVCYYSIKETINEAFFDILKTHPYNTFSGKPSLIKGFTKIQPQFKHEELYFCENTDTYPNKQLPPSIKVARHKEDFEKLYHLLYTIDEFDIKHQTKKEFIETQMKWKNNHTKLYIEQDGEAIATATATCETKTSAMVIAVATAIHYRNKGYASRLINALNTQYIYHKNKTLCLFYNNPSAGSIYHPLGYQTIGKWLLLREDLDA